MARPTSQAISRRRRSPIDHYAGEDPREDRRRTGQAGEQAHLGDRPGRVAVPAAGSPRTRTNLLPWTGSVPPRRCRSQASVSSAPFAALRGHVVAEPLDDLGLRDVVGHALAGQQLRRLALGHLDQPQQQVLGAM